MKKRIALGLALALAASVGTTAFAAAANPFTDVPAKHWSYNAIQQLAKAGIVDGYNDGQFKGDKTITRYEMAVMVAKAMAKEDKADASQKAMIDKLAAEFATELDNLGVRVTNLEKASSTPFGPSAQVYGDARTRYLSNYNRSASDATLAPNSRWQERFRINFDDNIADNVLLQSRITYQSSANSAGDTIPGGASNQSTGVVDVANFTFKNVSNTGADIKIGRDYLWQGYGLIAGSTGGYDEVKVMFNAGKEIKGWFAYGDDAPYIMYSSSGSQTTGSNINTNGQSKMNQFTGFATSPAVDVTTGEISYTPNKDLQFIGDWYLSNTLNYNYKVAAIGAKANLTPNIYLAGDFARNYSHGDVYLGNGYANPSSTAALGTAGADADTLGHASIEQKTAYFAQLGYTVGANNTNNGIDSSNPGAWGLFLNYKHLGGQAIDWNNTSALVFESISDPFLFANGEKGMGYGAEYVIAKNVRFTGTYEKMKSLDGSITRAPFTYIRVEYNY